MTVNGRTAVRPYLSILPKTIRIVLVLMPVEGIFTNVLPNSVQVILVANNMLEKTALPDLGTRGPTQLIDPFRRHRFEPGDQGTE